MARILIIDDDVNLRRLSSPTSSCRKKMGSNSLKNWKRISLRWGWLPCRAVAGKVNSLSSIVPQNLCNETRCHVRNSRQCGGRLFTEYPFLQFPINRGIEEMQALSKIPMLEYHICRLFQRFRHAVVHCIMLKFCGTIVSLRWPKCLGRIVPWANRIDLYVKILIFQCVTRNRPNRLFCNILRAQYLLIRENWQTKQGVHQKNGKSGNLVDIRKRRLLHISRCFYNVS